MILRIRELKIITKKTYRRTSQIDMISGAKTSPGQEPKVHLGNLDNRDLAMRGKLNK